MDRIEELKCDIVIAFLSGNEETYQILLRILEGITHEEEESQHFFGEMVSSPDCYNEEGFFCD